MDNNIIKNFTELLQPHLDDNTTILKYTTKQLTAPGENYGSLMLAIDVTLHNKKLNQEEPMQLVAKMCPPNEWLKEVFQTAISFKKECAVYKTIVPTLKAFQKEQAGCADLNFLPKCFGARISLNAESDVVDDDAVLLLENLKQSGFEVADRMTGFNFETTKLILKDLAKFHAVPIAMKLLQPELFKEKILPHLDTKCVFATMSNEAERTIIDFLVQSSIVKSECLPFREVIERTLKMNLRNLCNPPPPREPFATINHNDYWVNNTMIKFKNNKPVSNKMVDFQLIDYGSPGKDIVFLLFSSVQKEVLDKHYDDLLMVYYNAFIATLEELNCNTAQFTFRLFLEEISYSAKNMEFFHILTMLKHVLAIQSKVRELNEFSEEDLLSEKQVSNECRQKLPEVVLEFIKRKWIG